jgi:hypothetical protein
VGAATLYHWKVWWWISEWRKFLVVERVALLAHCPDTRLVSEDPAKSTFRPQEEYTRFVFVYLLNDETLACP